jgi:predicted O-linked N-acetylglucosamine transferase (SPINDLY family)
MNPALNTEEAFRLATQHQAAGRFPNAKALYQQVLQREPRHPEALRRLGVLARSAHRFDLALDLLTRAIEAGAPEASCRFELGLAHAVQGRWDEASMALERVLTLDPVHGEALLQLGNVRLAQGRLAEAEACYQKLVELDPGSVEGHHNLGLARRRQGRIEEAEACHRSALAALPAYAAALSSQGSARLAQGEAAEALVSYRRLVELRPDDAEAHTNVGSALYAMGECEQAVASLRRALELQPDSARAWQELGAARLKQDRPDEAIEHFRRALELQPGAVAALHGLGKALLRRGQPAEAAAWLQRSLAETPGSAELHSSRLHFLLLCQPSREAEAVFEAHREFDARYASALKAQWPRHTNPRDADRRLRIGYVSPDLRRHSVAFFFEPVLAHHDRERFDIHAYYNHSWQDEVTARLRSCVDTWVPCAAMSDEQLASRIRADGIDILVDLAGHTSGNRLLAFARKPAPVQATWLGYPATTGLDAMDYRLCTLETDPPGQEAWHSERIYRLPGSLWCYRAGSDDPPVPAPPPLLARGYVTFGSINHPAKVSPAALARWADILRVTPGSRLVMTSVPAGAGRQAFLERFAALGIGSERIEIHGRLSLADYRALLERIDIALDPFPYNGTTTTCDTLWAGIPVVSLRGETSVARSGHALLTSIGLSELVAGSEAEYVAIVVALARNPERLEALRRGLRPAFERSVLRDEAGFTRELEAAYREMWRKWCEEGMA